MTLMEEHIWILWFLRTRTEFYQAETVRRFLAVLVGQDFRVIADAESHIWLEWDNIRARLRAPRTDDVIAVQPGIDPAMIFTSGVSPLLLAEGDAYVAEQRPLLGFHAYAVTHDGPLADFQFYGEIKPEQGYILLSVDWQFFSYDFFPGEGFDSRRDYWIALLQEIYRCWHPLYAYRFEHEGHLIQPTKEEVRALDIHGIYGTNFFSPELVATLGRERLLSTPIRQLVELDDGGIFLQCTSQQEIRAAAKHLNLPPGGVDDEEKDEGVDEDGF